LTVEHELIRRAQEGDLKAFCQLAKNYERRVYLLALHFCRHTYDAEDLSQEVWLKAFKAIGGFRFQSSFYTWLRRILVNTFLDNRQSMMRESEKTLVRLESLEENSNELAFAGELSHVEAENGFHKKILVERVMRALGELTEQQRLMFLLKHREGMTYQEIAEVFDCTVGSVKKTLFRSLEKLRASFGIGARAGEQVPQPAGGKS
jgi:RNA polymerase sigma-70 factor, ECF subfamily